MIGFDLMLILGRWFFIASVGIGTPIVTMAAIPYSVTVQVRCCFRMEREREREKKTERERREKGAEPPHCNVAVGYLDCLVEGN